MEYERPDGYYITDDHDRLDLSRIHRWLSDESYWAAGTSLERVARSFRNSVALGCFDSDDEQVGVTRLVTDGATFALLTDVFVDADHRGRGLGQFLVHTALEHPSATDVRRILLATSDAHKLYRRFGFGPLVAPARWMERGSSSSGEQ